MGGRDLLDLVVLALGGLAAPGERTHLDQVDDADEVSLSADRDLQHQGDGAEPRLDHLDATVELSAGTVELVDEAHPGHAVLVRLTPNGLGLRLDTGNAVEDRNGTVEHA